MHPSSSKLVLQKAGSRHVVGIGHDAGGRRREVEHLVIADDCHGLRPSPSLEGSRRKNSSAAARVSLRMISMASDNAAERGLIEFGRLLPPTLGGVSDDQRVTAADHVIGGEQGAHLRVRQLHLNEGNVVAWVLKEPPPESRPMTPSGCEMPTARASSFSRLSHPNAEAAAICRITACCVPSARGHRDAVGLLEVFDRLDTWVGGVEVDRAVGNCHHALTVF